MKSDPIQPYLNLYREALLHRQLRLQTIRSYLFDVRQYLVWLARFDAVAPEAISKAEAEKYLDYLQTAPQQIRPGVWRCYSRTTISRKIGVLADFYNVLHTGEHHELLP